MFILRSPDFPLTISLPSGGLSLGTFSLSPSAITTGASFGTINTQLESPLVVEQAIAIPTYTGDNFTVTVSEVGVVALVVVGATTYTPSQTPSAPLPGEFIFDSLTGELTVYPATPAKGNATVVGLTVEYPELEGIPTTDIEGDYPFFFSQWNIEGTVSFSRGFRGHPSASLRFTSPAQNAPSIRQSLKNGSDAALYGVGYLVQSMRIVELSPKKYEQRLIFVDVQLQGKWDGRGSTQRSLLDKPLKIKKLATNGKSSIQRLCSSTSVGYVGPVLDIKVPIDTPATATTTIRSELESRAITALGFPYYSNPGAVEIRKWGRTTVHFLSDADVSTTEFSFDLPGHAAEFEGVQLTDEMNNVVVSLDNSNAGKNERITLYEGDPFPASPPRYQDAEPGQPRVAITLRDPSMAYPGGKTKFQKKTTYLNGSILEEEEETYGFIFCSVDVYNVFQTPDGVAARYNTANDLFSVYRTYWEKVKSVKTTYHYRADGYLEKIERRGWEKARFKQEGSSLEAVEFKKQLVLALSEGDLESAARLEKIIEMYQYPGLAVALTLGLPESPSSNRAVILPVEDVTQYTLEKFSKYYEDAEPSEDSDEPEPVFCKQETRTDNSYMLTPDPESTPEDEKPPLTTGKKFLDIKQIEIVYPKPGGQQSPEIFRENTITSNAQGAGLRNTLNVSYYRENKGRPGAHTRIERDVTDSDSPASGEDYSKYKYYLNSFDFLSKPDDPDGGSISFPDVDKPEDVRAIAQCDLSIRNSERAETISLQVRYNRNYCEGDLVLWRGRLWVIFGIQDNQKIERRSGNSVVKSEVFEISLGRLLKPPVVMTKKLRKENE